MTLILVPFEEPSICFYFPNENKIRLFSESGEFIRKMNLETPFCSLLQYNNLVWIANQRSISLLHSETFQTIVEWEAHEVDITAMIVFRSLLWTADCQGAIRVWEMAGEEIKCLNSACVHYGKPIQQLAVLSKHVVSATQNTVVIWDALKLLPEQEILLNSPIILPRGITSYRDHMIIATASGVHLWVKSRKTPVTSRQSVRDPLKLLRKEAPENSGPRRGTVSC